MADYPQDAAEALASIKEDGAGYTVTRRTSGAFNPITQTHTDPATAAQTVYAIRKKLTREKYNSGQDEALVAAVRKGRACCLLCAAAGLAFVPGAADRVTIDGKDYTIVGIEALSPGGVPILYTLTCIQA